MRKRLLNTILFASIAMMPLSSAALAETGDIAVGAKVSTLGFGADVTVGITSNINARTGFNAYNYNGESTRSNVTYDFDLDLLSFPILLDWHPLGEDSGIRLSSGILINKNKVKATALSQNSYTIGDREYSQIQVGKLNGAVDINALTPYVGFGWGNPFRDESGFSVSFDIGVAFQGNPDLSLTATGPIASDTTFQSDLKKEIQSLKDDTGELKLYPVISLGLTYTL